jgi:peroxiredoxin
VTPASKRDHRGGHRPRHVKAPKRREEPKHIPWKAAVIALAIAALVGASFVVPGIFEDEPGTSSAASRASGHGMATMAGDGPDVGSRITFAERDVIDGREISTRTTRGKKTLLFFSEGVMCQACFEQIRDIETVGVELEKQGIGLVSITSDSDDVLRQAIDQYGIRTPMIADDDRDMSAAFDTLGRGMHADTPGHAFVLLDEIGKVVWQRDYWLEPYRTMYVEPEKLLADLPRQS